MRAIIKGLLLIFLLSSILAVSAEAASGNLRNLTDVGVFTTHDPHDAEFYKDYLFIADGSSVMIYNISVPELPKIVTTFTDFNEPRKINGLSISEDRLYIAAESGWIYVLNISDPKKPEKLYQLNYLDSSNDVAVLGEYMFVADANTGLLIFDLYDRRNPSLTGMFYILKSNVSGSLQGWGGISVEVSGNYVFLSGDNNEGLYIIDISNKTAPEEVYHSTVRNVYDIALSGNEVYLARAGGTSDFDVLDISNIHAPLITGSFSIPGTASRSAIAIHPSGEYLYAASDDTWHIFRMPRTINPVEGNNSIDKTAIDVKVNNKTEITETQNRLLDKTIVSTPETNATEKATTGINAAFFIVLIVIVYLVLKQPK